MRFQKSVRRCLAAAEFFLLCLGILEVRAEEPADRSTKAPTFVLRITGSSTMCPMIAAIGERFQSVSPGS